jgi:hypothetical protein
MKLHLNKDFQYHNTKQPAAEYTGGDREWYLNGELHRADDPALEHYDDSKEWYLNGKRH